MSWLDDLYNKWEKSQELELQQQVQETEQQKLETQRELGQLEYNITSLEIQKQKSIMFYLIGTLIALFFIFKK